MCMRIILILTLIELSQEICQIKINLERREFIRYELERYGLESYGYSRIQCTNINPNDDLYSLLPQHYDYYNDNRFAGRNLILTNSSIPELTQKMWSSINFLNITIQANVEVIQSNAFNDSRVAILNLDSNRIRKIEEMSFSSSLENLSIQNNSLNEITTNNFQGLPALTKLNLKCNNISQIEEDSFDDLEHLLELDLSFNKLVELHVGQFKNLSHLRAIYLNNNLLKELNDQIFSESEALMYVYIQNNFITIIDTRLYPNSILLVNANNNQLMSADFSNLMNVEIIDLNHNNLRSTVKLLRHFTKMENLNRMDLSYNNLNEIRYDTFENFTKLKTLWLQYNFICSIELGSFRNLGNLQTLNLTHNKIKYFKAGNLPAIKHLYLSYNEFGPSINFYKMQNLKELDLTYNNIVEIRYDSFDNTTELEQLWLQYNSIRSLELGCFKNLEKLRQLNLSHNKIKSFEFGMFSGLYGLISLDISFNNLSHLDKNIFHSTTYLDNINIAYNNIKGVEIKNMQSRTVNLRKITLTGTEWSCHSLADFFRNDIIVTRGTFHNESNISGIPCNNTDDDDNKRQPNEVQSPGSFSEFQKYLEFKEEQESYKMTIIIVTLIALIIMFSVKYAFAKCYSWCIAVKVLISKRSKNEQERQLI